MKQKTSIDLAKYQKAMNFAAKKDVRYYLLGVCVQPCPLGGAMIVATDGHVLGAFHDPKGHCEKEIILSLENKRDIAQFVKEGAVRAVIETTDKEDGDVVQFTLYNKHRAEPQHEIRKAWYPKNKALIEGRFPMWEQLMPDELPEEEKPLVNGVRVSNLDKFLFDRRAEQRDGHAGIRLYPMGKDEKVVVFVHGEPDFIGILMPTKYAQKDKDSWWFKVTHQRTQEALSTKKAA